MKGLHQEPTADGSSVGHIIPWRERLELRRYSTPWEPVIWWSRKPQPKKHGRKRALTDQQVAEVRRSWSYNNYLWQVHRMNPALSKKPINMHFTDLAARFDVSAGVIQHVIDRKGAYSE